MFFDNLLKPIIEKSFSYIKDSQNLLQLCDDLEVDNKAYLYSCDFATLYTNIELKDAIYYTMDALVNVIDSNHINAMGLYELLKLVLFNNVFSFNKEFYKQIKGLAMGSNFGPSIANIVVQKMETKWLNINSPLVYKRFIDDIFLITKTNVDIESFKNNFEYLKLNIVNDNTVQFLDL